MSCLKCITVLPAKMEHLHLISPKAVADYHQNHRPTAKSELRGVTGRVYNYNGEYT